MRPVRTDEYAIVVYSDISCPWAHVAVHRLLDALERNGLTNEVPIDHRAFPLEIATGRPTSKEGLDSMVRVCMELEPEAGWSTDPDPWTYPVSTLPALEAVQAAKAKGSDASVRLDAALRRAMFHEWRCLAVHQVVLDIAATVEGVDVDQLWDEIKSGRGRLDVFEQFDAARAAAVTGSPTFVLPDGSAAFNPGVTLKRSSTPRSELTVKSNNPEELTELVLRARAMHRAD